MHYILLTHKIEGGGLQAVVCAQAEMLNQAGHEVTVVCNKENSTKLNANFKVEHIRFDTWRGRRKLQKLLQSLSDFRVLSHSFDAYWAMFWLRRYKEKTYYFVHVDYFAMYYRTTTPFKNFERTFNYNLLFNNKNMVFVSEGAQASMLNEIGIKPKRSKVIYPPIDFTKINHLSDIQSNIKLPEKFYISLGRLAKRKNVALTIQAFARIRSEDEHLVVVGEGEQMDSLKELVSLLKIQDKVVFVGWQQNPYPILKKAQALIMTSNIEGFGLNIVEAMSLGVPVISTDARSGPREILEPEYSDCLSTVGDLEDLVNKMVEFKLHRSEPRFNSKDLKNHVLKFNKIQVVQHLLKFTHANTKVEDALV